MGCDIHVHIEVKINGEWKHYNHPKVRWNYALFGKMAGVRRDDIEPIVPLRGLPRDVTFMTEFDSTRMGADSHSYSYLTAGELGRLREWCEEYLGKSMFWFDETFGYLFGNSLEGITEHPNDYPLGVEDVRLVFWFDN